MENDSQKHYSFCEGMPTKPDVDLLIKTWPELKVGDVLTYEQIAHVLGIDKSATRFKTITEVWRKRLLEKGLILNCDPGKGFHVATSREIVGATYNVLKFSRRKIHKQRRKLSVTKAENDLERQEIEHHGRLLLAHEKDLRKAGMNLLPSTGIKPAPQIAPPIKGEKSGTLTRPAQS